MLRTCSRCGEEFISYTRSSTCQACKRPAISKSCIYGDPLTPRELQLVKLIKSEALSTKEIANRLHLSELTIKVYLSTVYRKTGARSKVHLAIMNNLY